MVNPDMLRLSCFWPSKIGSHLCHLSMKCYMSFHSWTFRSVKMISPLTRIISTSSNGLETWFFVTRVSLFMVSTSNRQLSALTYCQTMCQTCIPITFLIQMISRTWNWLMTPSKKSGCSPMLSLRHHLDSSKAVNCSKYWVLCLNTSWCCISALISHCQSSYHILVPLPTFFLHCGPRIIHQPGLCPPSSTQISW